MEVPLCFSFLSMIKYSLFRSLHTLLILIFLSYEGYRFKTKLFATDLNLSCCIAHELQAMYQGFSKVSYHPGI